jgi:4-carboxymuconolactone decarboxylase
VSVPSDIDVGRLPRIAGVTYDGADARTREVWEELDRPSHGGPGPDTTHMMFRTFMHDPELMLVKLPYDHYLKYATALPVRHRELAILRSAWNCGVDDQWVNHTRIGLECGLTQEEIDRVARGPDAPGWSEEDATLLRAVDELSAGCRIADATWAALAQQYDARQLVVFLVLVGNYHALSYIQNCVGIAPVTGTSPNIPGNRFLFPEP